MYNHLCFHCGEHFSRPDKLKCDNEYCEIMTTDDGQLRTDYPTPELMRNKSRAISRGSKKSKEASK